MWGEIIYDNLNRVRLRDYSDSTPDVSYFYDGTGGSTSPNFAKGLLTKVSSSVSSTEYSSFDNLGRVLAHKQITDAETYNTAYTYNLSGALIEETYPSGRKVKNTLDLDGDLSKVETKDAAGAYQTRVSDFTYLAHGGVALLYPWLLKLGSVQNSVSIR